MNFFAINATPAELRLCLCLWCLWWRFLRIFRNSPLGAMPKQRAASGSHPSPLVQGVRAMFSVRPLRAVAQLVPSGACDARALTDVSEFISGRARQPLAAWLRPSSPLIRLLHAYTRVVVSRPRTPQPQLRMSIVARTRTCRVPQTASSTVPR